MTNVRDRLLDATECLVYRHGVHCVGIDRILATAKVAETASGFRSELSNAEAANELS